MDGPVAIIGIGLRLPGANDMQGLWRMLAAGQSHIRPIPQNRFDAAALKGDPRKGQFSSTDKAGWIDDADCFDAAFFGISPREAAWMDPQQRFALELAYHALEDAGVRPDDIAQTDTGVFLGACHWDYAELLEKHSGAVDAYLPTGIGLSIIANRVSHFLDLRGPSVTNDTACAASLTAVNDAVRSLHAGECSMALAGGVNLAWSPNHFVAFSKSGMLSPDGQAHSFDDRANGYVRGEGGGILLLKPLAQAEADADPIHGVIRGVGVNHGGRTRSLTVTNPGAQADLIVRVHHDAGVAPHTVGLIEAHGPGTPLGDPIEINGLKQAFATLGADQQGPVHAMHCAIGSIKTNIGHLEGAAGVAGIAKILAAFEKGQKPGMAGFQVQNRLINLDGTGFEFQTQTSDWPELATPRRACVSAFGFGGSNAHAVLEEAPKRNTRGKHKAAKRSDTASGPWAIPVSAPDETGLIRSVQALATWITGQDAFELNDLAVTLQTGRAALAERCVFVAKNTDDLRNLLDDWTAQDGVRPKIVGCSKPGCKALAKWTSAGVDTWPKKWRAAGQRIHGPLFPFVRERHWMDLSLAPKDQRPVPHPLLHRNTSTWDAVSFSSQLTGDTFLLADHVVRDDHVLPGVAALEMAAAATRLSKAVPQNGPLVFLDVVWAAPVFLPPTGPVEVETSLRRADSGFDFRISTPATQTDDKGNMYGRIAACNATAQTIDVDAIQQACGEDVPVAACYDRLRARGVAHGPAFRVLNSVSRSANTVVAEIKLPQRMVSSLGTMALHPSILDAAIQAWVALEEVSDAGAAVPFACRRITVHGSCQPRMVAHLRCVGPGSSLIREFDIDLCDPDGTVVVAFRGLVLRMVKTGDLAPALSRAASKAVAVPDGVVLAKGIWRYQPVSLPKDGPDRGVHIWLAGACCGMAQTLTGRAGSVTQLPDVSSLDSADAAFALYEQAHGLVRDMLRAGGKRPVRIILLVDDDAPQTHTAPLLALLRAAAAETPRVSACRVCIAGKVAPKRLAAIVDSEADAAFVHADVRYDADDTRTVWHPVAYDTHAVAAPPAPGGTYWITGGMGGLARHFTEWLLEQGAGRVVLSGRRATPSKDGQQHLNRWRDAGADVRYLPCDVAQPGAAQAVLAELGAVRGVIHAAGHLDDGYILTQGADRAKAVFAPKTRGTVSLGAACHHAGVETLLLCSSVAATFGMPGQAAYGAANAFMEAFAAQHGDYAAGSTRVVSVGWPLWQDGGMTVDSATEAAMERRLGLLALPTQAGLAALGVALNAQSGSSHIVLHGAKDVLAGKLDTFGAVLAVPQAAEGKDDRTLSNATDLKPFAIDYVRDILADVLETDPSRIRTNRALDEYGLDSISIVEATTRMELGLGPLSKTLFFEYLDLNSLADHLVEAHADALAALSGPSAQDDVTSNKRGHADHKPAQAMQAGTVVTTRAAKASQDNRHDIAIIGTSLHVAGADDRDAFWDMLSQGRHGFAPVPQDRWNNTALHHPERDILGKTVVKTGAFMPDIDMFDPRYFRISWAEAELMSPEVRLFLQASVEAFEDAGYSRETIARRYGGDVAVIMGSMTNEYDLFGFQNMLVRPSLASGSYTGTVPNMVSYYYGLTGPSYFLDTMCSASSTCIHEAVHMLRAGRCKMALAGGVSLLLHPQKLIATSQEHFTSKSAEVIRGYGLGAEGTILGEGVGAVVLKPLADARADGDHIHGIIIGSGLSNAGARNGFTVPSPKQQAVAIQAAFDDAGVSPATVGYVEGHGSGTALGDPIEVRALTQVFGKHVDTVGSVPLGTVKSNIAHLLAASGLAGVAKVLAQMRHGALAPSLHAEVTNPDIPFASSPFRVQTTHAPWPRLQDETGVDLPRRAGVTSIGAGGMNSHILIEEHVPNARATPEETDHLFIFSAMNRDRLNAVLGRFLNWCDTTPDVRAGDVAFTLQVGRNELPCRLAFVARSLDAVAGVLRGFLVSTDGGRDQDVSYTPSTLDADPPAEDSVASQLASRALVQIGASWCAGAAVDWGVLQEGYGHHRVPLPAYPFEKVRCWYREHADAPSVVHPIGAARKLHPFVGENLSDANGLRYRTDLHLDEMRDYLFTDHGVQKVGPSASLETALAVARLSGIAAHPEVTSLSLDPVDWASVTTLEMMATQDGIKGYAWTGESRHSWFNATISDAGPQPHQGLNTYPASADAGVVLPPVYDVLREQGIKFGPFGESITRMRQLPDGVVLVDICTTPQQDMFKRNLAIPAHVLGAIDQMMLCLDPDATVLGGVVWSHDIAHLLYTPASGTVALLSGDGTFVGKIDLGSATAMARPVSPKSEPDRLQSDTCEVAQMLRSMAATRLGFRPEDLALRETFHDLGFDSISLAGFATDINAAFGTNLSPAIFFEIAHLADLTDHLSRHADLPKTVRPDATKPKPAAPLAVSARLSDAVVGPARDADKRVAIIGLAGRFPGSPDADSFIDNLMAGRDLTCALPMARYSTDYAARMAAAGFARHGGFLDDIDKFDAEAFKMSPHEAARLDPQHRLLLETTWRALENAGYTPEDLPRDTGVFVGITATDYATLWTAEGGDADGYLSTGNSLAMAANRLSHFLNVSGLSRAIDTACSSSLVALLAGRDAVLSGQSGAAIVGGVNLCLALEGFAGPAQAGMLSPGGRCRSFGQGADGYARAEGCAVVLLKRLDAAQREGDRILAVIVGGAENHGGHAGALTAPNARAQGDLISRAMAGLDVAQLSCLELHGTGTELGDPVEINGVRRALSTLGDKGDGPPIWIGSVKSNIGHAEAAAGLAGVTKLVMAMKRGALPPTLHADPVSPHVDLSQSRLALLNSVQPWPTQGAEHPRLAGVSSFGFGGANAHVVLESWDHPQPDARAPLPARAFADTRFWTPRSSAPAKAVPKQDMLMFTPVWHPDTATTSPIDTRRIVLACDTSVHAGPDVDIRHITPVGEDDASRYTSAALALMAHLKSDITEPLRADLVIQLVVPDGSVFAGLFAMLVSAAQEEPRLIVQLFHMPDAEPSTLAMWLTQGSAARSGTVARYLPDGQRQVQTWAETPIMSGAQAWRNGGVYIVTGGCGGIGRHIARAIATQARNPILVLTGRRRASAHSETVVDELRALGAVPVYRQVDVTDVPAVQGLIAHTVEVHQRLTGVIHCAGVLQDALLTNQSDAALEAVLAPKVAGTSALYQAARPHRPEVFALMSSLAAPFGNSGQIAYAAANGFQDAIADRADAGVCAIDWPLWADGGMRVDETVKADLFSRMGQQPLATAHALDALGTVVSGAASGPRRTAVISGDVARIRSFFALHASKAPALPDPGMPQGGKTPQEAVTRHLKTLFSKVSGVSEDALTPDALLADFGIDSLMITALNKALETVFSALPKTLFFRCLTLGSVADFLIETQPDACARWTIDTPTAAKGAQSVPAVHASDAGVARQQKQPDMSHAPIAIIGIAGQYPDAPDLAQFWSNLVTGHDAVRDIPAERWSLDGFYNADMNEAARTGQSASRWGGFLDGFADFDPLFFRISPRDAAAMDPQERLFLMTAWAAMEDAGYTPDRLHGALSQEQGAPVGVFAGITKTGFALHAPFRGDGGAMVRPSTSFASVANRVSHVLGLSGPSLAVDTMCSASLVAIDMAVSNLRQGRCTMAFAGGVNLYLHSSTYIELSASYMLSPTGRCRSFGSGADGFVPGEGVGCVLLKPLAQAVADGDQIHVIIRGSAVNHAGPAHGYTVPTVQAQCGVVRAALADAGLTPDAVSYIEAHGTGTALGDPIELDGLTSAFATEGISQVGTQSKCALGSVKSAIGHLEAAAGIAGLTKVVLQMRHRTLAPSLHSDTLNPNLTFEDTPFYLQRAAAPWIAKGPRIAGVSSFGAGGANAHIVIEEAPAQPAQPDDGLPHAVVLSAADTARLKDSAERLLAFLQAHGAAPIADWETEMAQDLAQILAVDPQDIDLDEGVAMLALDRSQMMAFSRAIASRTGQSPSLQDMALAGSVRQLGLAIGVRLGGSETAANLPSLRDIAHTLRHGRVPMAARLGLIATDHASLIAALNIWLARPDETAVIAPNVPEPHDDRMVDAVQDWIDGGAMTWADRAGRVVSLPTYPFEKQRFWVPCVAASDVVSGSSGHDETLAPDDVVLEKSMLDLECAIAKRLGPILDGIERSAVLCRYQPWFDAAQHLLQRQSLSCDQNWASVRAAGTDMAQLDLAEAALSALPEILTGSRPATEVLFPDGRQTLVEAVYKDNRIAARFSQASATAVAQIVAQRDGPLRILEIGAGTGGTSEPVFAALRPHHAKIADYTYTDVSRAFLIHAERHYRDRVPGLQTALFDVDRSIAEQGIARSAYDIVIAANVLHATTDIRATLGRVRQVLAPGGSLVLNETSMATLFTHVTFGLLEGWWRFTDPDLRIPGTPSLTPDNWKHALEDAGMTWRSGSHASDLRLGQQIVIAERPHATDVQPHEVADIQDIGAKLRQCLCETLNIAADALDPQRSFADYGLDSILGADFVHRLNQSTGMTVAQTTLYDVPNAAALERHLMAAMPRPAAANGNPFVSANSGSAPAIIKAPVHDAHDNADRRHAPIAIIGAAGRFAGATDLTGLWGHLAAGSDLTRQATRFGDAPLFGADAPRAVGTRGSFLDDIDCFDAPFFGISGAEALCMDPQQRLFLEEAWKTLEHAGHAGASTQGARIGVFAGCSHGDYGDLLGADAPGQAFWGNTASLVPARVAYWLDLKGPALAVDTACSSSLVALHLACQSLRNEECDMALAGGVFVQSTPRFFRSANAAGMLSPTGRCAAFGADADGIVPGEAVASVLLCPLDRALAEGDTVLGIIRGSGVNQDGTTNGITAPSAKSQESLIRHVYRDHDIDPDSIDYIEVHGTGTPLGDPIEHAALARVFAGRVGAVALGSVKSNIGHATTAAGIAGVCKVLLALEHEVIPPTLHLGAGNPAIDETSVLSPVHDAMPWPATGARPRRAGISSFGFSGTNAHVVIEAAPEQLDLPDPDGLHLIVVSARSQDALRKQAAALSDHLTANPDLSIADVAYTLVTGRLHLGHRLVCLARTPHEFTQAVTRWVRNDTGALGYAEVIPKDDSAASPDPSSGDRTAMLNTVKDQFLAGLSPDPGVLFSAPRRRVALPGAVLEGRRYWPDTAPVLAQPKDTRATTAPTAPSPSVAAPKTPKRVQLCDLDAAKPVALARTPELQRVALAPVTAPSTIAPTAISKEGGIAIIQPSVPLTSDMLASVLRALGDAGQDEEVRAVVLVLEAAPDATTSLYAPHDAPHALTCAVPVVAAFAQPLQGGAVDLMQTADVVITAHDIEQAADTGRDGSTDTVPVADLRDAAITLAKDIANAPRQALILLKAHMRHDMARLPALPKPAAAPRLTDPTVPHDGRVVDTGSPVVSLHIDAQGVAVVRMQDTAGRNMFTDALMDGLERVFALIETCEDVKAVVLTGYDSWFACGGTPDGLTDLQEGGSQFTDRRIYTLPLACSVPVVAAMQGHAIGAGWSMGLYCDHAVWADEGVYHSNYLWFGFTPGAGATLVFPYRLGDDLGREVLFSAREYRGRHIARRSSDITARPAREVLNTALGMARTLAQSPRDALIAAKAQSAGPLRDRIEQVLPRELAMHAKTFVGNDHVRDRIAERFKDHSVMTGEPAPTAPAQDLRDCVVTALAKALMIETVDIRDSDSFLDLGLDSILAVTWIRSLNAQLDIALPATVVYAHPTVDALVRHVATLVEAPKMQQPVAPFASPPPSPVTKAEAPARTTHTDLAKELVASLANALMIETSDIRDTDSFLDLGLDSILAVTWIRSLNGQFGLTLPATVVYAYPSVGSLIAHIELLLGNDTPQSKDTASPARVATSNTDIAIIGAAGQFPKAQDLSAFWDNIRTGRDCISEVPASRFSLTDHYDPDPQAPGKTYCKWMGALDDPASFDAAFFNILPREADLMDPQQRLFLQTAWHAIEDAGIDPTALAGRNVAVFAAAGSSGYSTRIADRNTYSLMGASGSILAARLSYFLDLTGQAVSIDTACSSSLVAIVQACEALLAGTCHMALAGGVSVLASPEMHIDTAKVGMLSPQGRCHTFDAAADGFVPGEGVGVVTLKRLSDAIADGDPVHAVVKGWGTNQDGRSNGMTAPNPKAQAALIKDIHTRFDIAPDSIRVIECHGTGTALGDPIEIEGLDEAFSETPAAYRCAVGSVKANVGHLLAAAGVAGAIKAMLTVQKRVIAPVAGLNQLNSHIPFAQSRFAPARDLTEWRADGPLRAGVSSFGFSGTNAHIVLEGRAPTVVSPPSGPYIAVLSTKDTARLAAQAATFERHISEHPDLCLAALSCTLRNGRTAMDVRAAFVFETRDDALRKLAAISAGADIADVYRNGAMVAGAEDVAAWLRSGDRTACNNLARHWAAGGDVTWPDRAHPRLHLPGYPFAKSRHWIDATPAHARALVGRVPDNHEIGRLSRRITGDEPFLTTHTTPEHRLMAGAFLPEMARNALGVLADQPVLGLRDLVWGPPVSINGHARTFTCAAFSDPGGQIFRIGVDDAFSDPCLIGAVDPLVSGSPPKTEISPDLTPGTSVVQAYDAYANTCATHSGPALSTMAVVTAVTRNDNTLFARLRRPLVDAPGQHEMLFCPRLLDPVLRLAGFANGQAGSVPFPLQARVITGYATPPEETLVQISKLQNGDFDITVYDLNGTACLIVKALRVDQPGANQDIRLHEKETA